MKNNHQHGFLIYAAFLGAIPVKFSQGCESTLLGIPSTGLHLYLRLDQNL